MIRFKLPICQFSFLHVAVPDEAKDYASSGAKCNLCIIKIQWHMKYI
jgi:hypothetical protein